ncbi:MAG: tetratricopeptide repeat protein [Chloroflexi bacterium]|nr:tetratricopeptide repeat protein [Chloroflexota bacterium]
MTEFQVGDLIENRYRVLSVNETGGMGTLYHVSDEAKDGEIVALKTVRLSVSAAEAPQRVEYFQREFQILTQLRHPNLLSVHDYGIMTEGELYFTMEWVAGEEMDPDQFFVEPEAVIPLMVQVCRALAYLHARGVIHGDLKPANILLLDDVTDAGQQIKIVDFGLAGEVRSPETRVRYYSQGYSAPETRGQYPIDHRSDLYSLGAIWYALLLREPPMFMFHAERMVQFALDETLKNQTQIPVEIGSVIARLLATSPEERYASANEVIEAVNEITADSYELETRETASSYALRTRFVNREAEMEMLEVMWEHAKAGEGKLVLVSGESGVGKTRLVEELKVRAEIEGARVVWGQCVESGGSAYHPWREVLRVLVRYVENTAESGLDIKRVGPVLAAILPELWDQSYMAGLAPPAELDPLAAQQRLHSAIVQILRASVALRPTIVVIENAQWADQATLAMSSFLTHLVGQMELLVCVTYRSDEISTRHPLVRLMSDHVQRIPIQALSPKVTTDLACSMLGLEELPALLTEQLQRTTGGNALFVQELIRSLAAEGQVLRRTVEGWQVDMEALESVQLPESIHQVVERRLTQLLPDARQVLGWAAMMGVACWEGGIAEIGEMARPRMLVALRELLDIKLLAVRDESAFAGEREYLFTSPTVREVSYESLPEEKKRDYHSRTAAWLMARREDEVNTHLGLIANHLERSGQTQEAVVYLRRAGEQAVAQFANVDAIRYWSRALDLIPPSDLAGRYEVVMARERVYHLQGAREDQSQDLAILAELVEALDDDRRRIAVALRRASYAEAASDYEMCIEAAQQAVELAKNIHDILGEAEATAQWGGALWRKGDYDASRSVLERALSLAREVGSPEIEAMSLYNLGAVPYYQGNYAESSYYNELALELYRKVGNRSGESETFNNLGILAMELYDYAQAKTYLEQALDIALEIGDRRRECLVVGNIGSLFELEGDYAEAKVYHEKFLRLAREIGERSMEGSGIGILGNLYLSLGDYDRARECLEQALPIAREVGALMFEGKTLFELGLLSLRLGDNEMALEYGQQALEIAREIPLLSLEGSAQVCRGYALAGLERWAEAADAYQQALNLWPQRDRPDFILEPLAGLAHVFLSRGDLRQAQARVEEILGYLESERVQNMAALGEVYWVCVQVLQANRDSRAQAVLEAAYQMLQKRVAKIASEELRRSFLENVTAHREIANEWERMHE